MTSCKSLIVRNLAPAVTEETLGLIFGHIAPVESLSMIPVLQSAVIEFQEYRGAEQALISMNKRPLAGQVIQIEWNYENGKISVRHPTVSQEGLNKIFERWNSTDVSATKDKKGAYFTVSFPTAMQAELAAFEMQGHSVLSLPMEITLDDDGDGESSSLSEQSSTTESSEVSLDTLSYQDLFAQTPPYHTDIYIKKLPKNVSKHEIVFLLQQYGTIHDLRLSKSRRRAVIRLDTHANATAAIFGLKNNRMDKEIIRIGWWTKDTSQPRLCSPIMSSVAPYPAIVDLTFARAPAIVNNENMNQYYY